MELELLVESEMIFSKIVKNEKEKCIQSHTAATSVMGKANLLCVLCHTYKFHHVHWSWCPVRPLLQRWSRGTYTQFENSWSESRSPVGLLLCKAKLNYVYLILKLHIQSSRSPVRLVPCESKLSYLCEINSKSSW